MSALTMELVRIFDRDNETRSLARCVSNDNLRDQDNTIQIAIIAERLQVDSDVIYSYIWLKNLIEESDGEDDSYEAAMIFAEQCGIDFDVFQRYLEARQVDESTIDVSEFPLFQDAVAIDADLDRRDLEAQEAEAARKGMNLFEYREHLADLQLDAYLCGE